MSQSGWFKDTSKRILRSATRRLPWGARMTILDALVQNIGVQDARARFMAEHNIKGVLIEGEWGLFQGRATDSIILPIYGSSGTWANRTNRELIAFFEGRGGTYLDIGANIGLTTVPTARNSSVRCFAFEPEPENFRNLTENVRRNVSTSNVTMHEIAVYSRETTLQFALANDFNSGDHRIVSSHTSDRETIDIKAKPLDAFIGDVTRPLAAKIDVQGAEGGVIDGGTQVLAMADFVIIEFCPFLLAKLTGGPVEVVAFLAGFVEIAILDGEQDGELAYVPAATACAELTKFYADAVHDEFKFKDVYARR